MKDLRYQDCSHARIDISSHSNRSLKEWKSLLTGRGIRRHQKALVSGSKIVSELLRLEPGIIQVWITPPDENPPPSEAPHDVQWCRLNWELFRELDVHGTGSPLIVVKIPEFIPFRESEISDNVILLIPFQDPLNVGSVIRSSAAFGVSAIVLLKEAAHPFHPKSIRAAGTPVFTMSFMTGPSIYKLRAMKRPLVALSPVGINISTFRFPERFALLPGLEGPGLSEEVKPDFTLSIPMKPHVESLNAAVATSIVLYEWKRSKNMSL